MAFKRSGDTRYDKTGGRVEVARTGARPKRGLPNLTEHLCYDILAPELNSPRTDFSHFPYSTLIFVQYVKEIYFHTTHYFPKPTIAKYIVNSFVASIYFAKLTVMQVMFSEFTYIINILV